MDLNESLVLANQHKEVVWHRGCRPMTKKALLALGAFRELIVYGSKVVVSELWVD